VSLTLAIVACGPQLEVALHRLGARAVSIVRLAGVTPRSTLLLAAIDLLVEDSGEGRGAVSRIVVTRGPGSFTGIRSGLATAAGLAAAGNATVWAYDSLLTQAARVTGPGVVCAAQPGRRGELYTREYLLAAGDVPVAQGGIAITPLGVLEPSTSWVAAEALDLGGVCRAAASRTTAEALIALADSGLRSDPVEPLYVEGPPIHRG
jgi:tRNA threonylcarbamoyladenosine biosynthesis protein TsaB